MDRLLIVDGHNLLFQMFFGMPSRIIGAKGCAIQGVIGFVGAINKMIKLYQPSHLLVMFDGEKNNPRKEILADYKANRIDYSTVPDDENPFTQLEMIYNALDYMGITHTETHDCETDDVIASYALSYGKECEIYISSFDSDYFQLINKNVRVIRYRGDSSILCDEEYILKKYGIPASLYLDYKCLVGDSSDNIPGIRGIGPKTAAKLINEFGNLAQIRRRSSDIANEKIRSAILAGDDVLERNLSLIRLSECRDLPFTTDEIRLNARKIKTMEVIRGIGH